ncbi:MAG: DMT family transporter [Bacteroidales bacterium]|nr:DMT family transporter [Bacteroidales bacterium]
MKRTLGGKLLVYLVSVVSIVLWGMSYIWSDQLLRLGIPVVYIVCIRSLVAGVVLMLLNLILGHSIRIRRKDLPKFLLLAFCEPFIYFVCETYGIKLTESPTYSALVIATAPIFSVAAGVALFHERINWVNILGIGICLVGLGIVTHGATEVGEHFVAGVALLVVAVISEVGYASCTKSLSSDYKPMVIVQYQFLIGGVLLLPLFFTLGLKGYDPVVYMSWDVWKPILCLAILCSSIAFTLWASTIKNLGVAKASIFLAMIPVVTAFIGAILGTELLTPIQWTGIGISFAGLVLTQYVRKKKD